MTEITARPIPDAPRRALRVAHLTDIHIQPELNAPEGLARCFRNVQQLQDKPDFILNGGDTIMDALSQSKDRVKLQWELWHSILKNENSLPMVHCIGNHDVWGMKEEKGDLLYGKAWAMDIMRLEKRYRSFDQAGWHFIILDSTHLTPQGTWYQARLDEEQMEWLKNDLAATPATMHIAIVSHIPILSASVFFDGKNVRNNQWEIPGGWMHLDAPELIELFYKYPNIRLCLSGHIHLRDTVDYNGITYLCNGAVCGSWWEGSYGQTAPGYGLVDLYEDGSVIHRYVHY
jgi:Icc protein